jgi:subtilisin family serine protease
MIAPACLANALSVGAVWDEDLGSQTWFGCTDATTEPDQVTCWSNSSTTTDVFGPGAEVTASRLDGITATLAGTSYATPMVAACAAILADEVPSATPSDLAMALTTSDVEVTDTTNGLSFPRLDCVAAYHVLPEPSAALQLVSGIGLVAGLRRRRARRG